MKCLSGYAAKRIVGLFALQHTPTTLALAAVGEADAAIAFGCTPATMRENYLSLDEDTIVDDVFKRI